MSNSYVDGKVREALMAAKGSRTTAQKLLMAWAVEDPQLMQGIAQPFLKAIAAAAVERGARQLSGGGAQRTAGGGRPASSSLSKEALADVLGRLGRDPDEMPPARPAASGAGASGPAAARPGAMRSATAVVHQAGGDIDHAKSMLTIAKAFAAKKVR